MGEVSLHRYTGLGGKVKAKVGPACLWLPPRIIKRGRGDYILTNFRQYSIQHSVTHHTL